MGGVHILVELVRHGALSVVSSDGETPAVLTRLLPGGNMIHKVRPDVIGTRLWREHIEEVTARVVALRSLLTGLERLLGVHAALLRLGVWLAVVLGALGGLLGATQGVLWGFFAAGVGLVLPTLARAGLRLIVRRLLGEIG